MKNLNKGNKVYWISSDFDICTGTVIEVTEYWIVRVSVEHIKKPKEIPYCDCFETLEDLKAHANMQIQALKGKIKNCKAMIENYNNAIKTIKEFEQ